MTYPFLNRKGAARGGAIWDKHTTFTGQLIYDSNYSLPVVRKSIVCVRRDVESAVGDLGRGVADAAAAAQRVLGRGEGGHVETVVVQVVVAVRVVVVGPRAGVRVVQTSRSTVRGAAIAPERRAVHKSKL